MGREACAPKRFSAQARRWGEAELGRWGDREIKEIRRSGRQDIKRPGDKGKLITLK